MANGDFHYNTERFCKPNEIQHWRRNWTVHQIMEQLYRFKGGTKEQFNDVPLRIVFRDLDFIESEVKTCYKRDSGSGWFPPEDGLERQIAFIKKIKTVLEEGHSVYYNSSW